MRGVAGVAGVLVKWAQVFDTAIRFTADASASWPVVTTLPHTPLAYPDGWRLRRAARHGPLRGGAVEPVVRVKRGRAQPFARSHRQNRVAARMVRNMLPTHPCTDTP